MKPARLLRRILQGSVGNVDFDDLVRLLIALGFREIGGRGSHRVFARSEVTELLNLQEEKGQAKPYQVRQVVCRGASVRSSLGGREMSGYPIEVFWSDEDEAWIADVPDLPFCTAHASTPRDAVAEVELAVEAWLDAARASGRDIPQPSPRALRA